MGYQGGRRYGGYYEDNGRRENFGREQSINDRYSTDRDRASGRFAGPSDSRRPPTNYEAEDRGFFDRAGDEIRSWFGDEDAERRREYDEQYYNRDSTPDYRDRHHADRGYGQSSSNAGRDRSGRDDHSRYGAHHDSNYHSWRLERIAELDRDYSEYQRENRDRFHQEFTGWRARRHEQRQALKQVREHMEVVGSDGEHIGEVDKLRGDRIILTKNDKDAGGAHHSVPCGWIKAVDAQRVTLEKTADQAQSHWREEGEQQARYDEGRYDQTDDLAANRGSILGGTNYR